MADKKRKYAFVAIEDVNNKSKPKIKKIGNQQ
jgi:hypothetical protein